MKCSGRVTKNLCNILSFTGSLNDMQILLNQPLCFSLPSIIFNSGCLTGAGNRSLLLLVPRVMSVGCDW